MRRAMPHHLPHSRILRISGERGPWHPLQSARFAATHVARKLVEQKHKRECAFPAFLPSREPAARRSLVHRKESDRIVRSNSCLGSYHLSGPASRQKVTISAGVVPAVMTDEVCSVGLEVATQFLAHPSPRS